MANTLISRLQSNTFNTKQWLGAGLLAAACMAGQQAVALQPLTDTEMAAATGQSLIALSVIAPAGQANSQGNPNGDTTFYKLSIQAILEMNLNVDRLQLGCGGDNENLPGKSGACDIDIERLRLHGLDARAEGQPIVIGQPELAGPDTGPRGSAVITNPYVELAIRNNGNAASRSLAGVRFGAENIDGATSIGENPDLFNVTDDTGFNRFSGYARFAISDLKLPVGICAIALGAVRADPCPFIGFILNVNPLLATAEGSINNPATGNKHFHTVDEVRLNTTNVTGIPLLTGSLNFLGLPIPELIPLTMTANMTLGLKTLHRIDFDGAKDVFISTQQDNLRWKQTNFNDGDTGATTGGQAWSATMERGWALNTPNVEFRGFESERLHVTAFEALGGILGFALDVGAIDTGARPADNCWGALTFC